MPYVLKHNRNAIDDKLARLARWLDIGNSFDDVQNWILDLRTEFSIPHTAAELGVDGTRLDELAKMAAEDPTAGGNPVFVSEAEMRQMYDDSMSGKL